MGRAPFDRIMITAAAAEVPQALVEELVEGGIMVLPLGPHAGPQSLTKLTKDLLNIDYSVQPTGYWLYNGKNLKDLYDETYSYEE